MATKVDVRTSLTGILQDDARFLTPEEIDDILDRALNNVTTDSPQRIVKDISGDGTADYPLPSEYIKGFSSIDSVEYPAGENPPQYSQEYEDYYVYEDPTKSAGLQLRLRFKLSVPGASEKIRIKISAPHTLTLTTSSLNFQNKNQVVFLAASFAFRALAARFTQTTDPTIDADSVEYGAAAQNYLFLSREWMGQYKSVSGLNTDIKAAQAFVEIDSIFASGDDMLFHPRNTR